MSDTQNTESKYSNIRVNYKIWITSQDEQNILGDGKWKLLKEIDNRGSLTEAAKFIGVSYRKAWGDLKKIEETLGLVLLIKQRGGVAGGRTTLTDEGKRLLDAYEALQGKFQNAVNDLIIDFKKTLKHKK